MISPTTLEAYLPLHWHLPVGIVSSCGCRVSFLNLDEPRLVYPLTGHLQQSPVE